MAVTVNATGTTLDQAAATTAPFAGLTVAAGANIVLVVELAFKADPGTISVCSWDVAGANQPLTIIGTRTQAASGYPEFLYTYGLVAPATGNKTLTVTWANSVALRMNAIALNGANQTGGTTTFAGFTKSQDNGTSPISVTVSSATGNMVVVGATGDSTVYSSSSGTEFMNTTGGGWSAAASYTAGAASVATTWVASPTNGHAMHGVDVVAAGGGAAIRPNNCATLGVGQ